MYYLDDESEVSMCMEAYKMSKIQQVYTHIRSVRDCVHSALLRILNGKGIPKKKRTLYDIAAYRIKQKPLLSVVAGVVKNPLSGKQEERVLVRPRQCSPNDVQKILLRKVKWKLA